ncbi:MAG: RNA polymerase sigma factor [Fuerstiella sp.]
MNRDACRGDWEDRETFGRWLRGVARNRYRNWRRSWMRRERRVVSADPTILDETIGEGQQEEDQRIVRLRTSIEQLPRKQRQVVMMHYLEETSVKEVAALLSVSVKTVEGRLYQARRALKRMMDDSSSASIGKALLL